ncbi:NmrA-like family domain-containing protein 1 [Cyphellophora attinorum]|uniref:NmrA-like family domain-containing protein 1 n=1 Tax=Cyphellophora attinorum TaxID=1664694 RepID=A0A0N1HU23_9EURO|nr:NmrA-like family domain-containing protein 1 [Phialophora attinorum]KPI40232.1 NmrA-like family domain-containing protein 1 [Phialophora attinorum]
MSKKILTIFGATGNQGGSVVSVILGSSTLSSKYQLRAITRDTTKPNAVALKDKGVQLAKADLNDAGSVAEAIKGSYGVFAVTNYWETMDKDVEYNQGKNIVDAAKAEGVKHLVWSGLPNVTKVSNGELTLVEHFDSKADVTEYGNKSKGDSLIFSTFMPGYFMSNLPGQIKKQEDGQIGLSLPWNAEKTWVPLQDIRADTGKFVAGLFEAGSSANGVAVQGASEWIHPSAIVAKVAEVSGQDVKFIEQPLDVETTKSMPKIPGELAQNMLFVRDYSYFGPGAEQKQAESDKFLPEELKKKATWDEFAKAQKWSF